MEETLEALCMFHSLKPARQREVNCMVNSTQQKIILDIVQAAQDLLSHDQKNTVRCHVHLPVLQYKVLLKQSFFHLANILIFI